MPSTGRAWAGPRPPRRYMDEGAPPLMAGEAPPPKGIARNHSLMDVFRERKARYWSDWRSKPEVMLWQLPLPPGFALYMLVNQLVKWSSVKVVWPAVQPALGVPITGTDVEADTTHSLRVGAQQKDAPDAPYCPQPKPDRGKREAGDVCCYQITSSSHGRERYCGTI